MYPRPKRTRGTWIANIFVTLCLLFFAGAIVFGILISRDGGAGFRNLVGGDEPFQLSK